MATHDDGFEQTHGDATNRSTTLGSVSAHSPVIQFEDKDGIAVPIMAPGDTVNAVSDLPHVLGDAAADWLPATLSTTGNGGILYAIDTVGDEFAHLTGHSAPIGGALHWYRHEGRNDGSQRWQGPRTVGRGWSGLKHVFPGDDGIIYAIDPIVEGRVPQVGHAQPSTGGNLHWYRHTGRADGTFHWEGPKVVARGWGEYKHVFYGGSGVIYAVEPSVIGATTAIDNRSHISGGRLLWFRHVGRADGSSRWEGPRVVARAWDSYTRVFSGGAGIIYAIEPDDGGSVPIVGRASLPSGGNLVWYRHLGCADGSAKWEGPRVVSRGWAHLEHVFAGDGVIYGVEPRDEGSVPLVGRATLPSGGRLFWYRHLGRDNGTNRWAGPRKVGDDWGGLERVFAEGDGSPARPATIDAVPHCTFMDPPGSPLVGIRAYGLKESNKRASTLTYSVTGTIPGQNLAALVQTAFSVWMNATIPAPGLSPRLTVLPAASGAGDIAISVGPLPAQTSGSTARDGSTIVISSTFFSGSSCSLLATLIHETGHALGILHSTSVTSVMNPANCAITTPAADDIAAIRVLYGWNGQRAIPGVGTDASPALCACGSSLVMAWKGINETNLWVSRSSDGVNWTPQARVFGAASTDGPTLAWDGTTLWMAFRGVANDDRLYWSACTDTSANFAQGFGKVTPIDGTGSAVGPSMTIFNGAPLLAWRGAPGDNGLYYSAFSGGSWAPQQSIGGVASSDRPSLCIDVDGLPRMVWRGSGDEALYTSALVGIFWQPQELVRWIVAGNGPAGTIGVGYPGSASGPSIASPDVGSPSFTAGGGGFPSNVFMVWRGVTGDSGIYFTQGAQGGPGQPPVEWSTQANIEGVATSARPAIAFFGNQIYLAWKGSGGDHTIWTTQL